MFSLNKLLLLISLTAASLLQRDYKTVQTDFTNLCINADNLTAKAAVVQSDNIDSGLFAILAQNEVNTNFSLAYRNVLNSTNFTTSQAGPFIRSLNTTLIPKLRLAFDVVVARKRDIAGSGFESFELTRLRLASTAITRYASAIVARMPAPSQVVATSISNSFSLLASSANSAWTAAAASGPC